MRRKIHLTMLVTLLMVPLTQSEVVWGATPSFGIIDLGTLGGVESRALDVNIHGEVVGWSLNPSGDKRAFLWLPRPAYGLPDGMNDLGVLPTGIKSEAHGINVHGQVVGESIFEDPNDPGFFIRRAFLWENGVMTDLGAPEGASNSSAYTINEHGQVAGSWSFSICCSSKIYLWLPEAAYGLPAGANDLGFIQFYEITGAAQINSLGQIAVGIFSDSRFPKSVLWLPSSAYGLGAGLNDLGTFGGMSSFSTSLNEQGQLVGYWRREGEFIPARGFLWENGVMTDLGTMYEDSTFPFDINRWGQVVGQSLGILRHALLWEEGSLFDLNDLIPGDSGWELNLAYTVNDLAQIVGFGTINGEKHAFLLNAISPPIPTLSTYGLIALTLVLLIVGTIFIQRKRDFTNQTLIL